VEQVVAWLQGQGLGVVAVARGRNWVAASGTAAQIESSFQTELHQYFVHGETHFANATEPSVPAALGGIVRTVRGLNDFRLQPGKASLKPANTSGTSHYLAPNDFATIYDLNPLYAAGINGSGQTLVVAGQTQIEVSDITTFRSSYGLPASDPQILLVPGSRSPGIVRSNLPEADLDLEWSGAVARNATIIYVYAEDVTVSIQYAIDQNLAPVLSSSYGSCEPETPSSEITSFEGFAKQGNAEGITWINAAGDSGGADCDDDENPGLAVDTPASIPEVTGMGGTEFAEGSGNDWSATNTVDQASALSYIPEKVWNDSAEVGQPNAGGGGVSIYFSRPSWQIGTGVPANNARNVPDISISASPNHDGYLVYTGGSVQIYGGTSFGAPTFAGIATLLNQYLVSSGAQPAAGLGNMNPGLYVLAQTTPAAFHDITTGNNIVTVPCASRSRACSNSPAGYSATIGYDNASGLGSVDAYNLVANWNNGTSALPATTGPAFFNGETLLSGGIYYLQFPDGNLFGYYGFLSSSILYHLDMGYEAFVASTGNSIYFYDFASGHWWSSSAGLFPYLYDFTLHAWIYYFPSTANPGHYTANPRYFSNLTTGQIFTM
jgi:subtilase family serine protease